jgi:hypothetical protein
MNPVSDDHSAIPKRATAGASKRSRFDSSLILGIALIALFLILFVLEFSRILNLTGKVHHAPSERASDAEVTSRRST